MNFYYFLISAGSDGGVTVSLYDQSKIWVYHPLPAKYDLSGIGISSIGAIGGSYRPVRGTATTTPTIIPEAATTTTTTPAATAIPEEKKCPSKQLLGDGNPKLEKLRYFRDGTLAQTAVGRGIIRIYYDNADSINAALGKSPLLRDFARRMLEAVAPLMGRQ
jgi:hypothetical protein